MRSATASCCVPELGMAGTSVVCVVNPVALPHTTRNSLPVLVHGNGALLPSQTVKCRVRHLERDQQVEVAVAVEVGEP